MRERDLIWQIGTVRADDCDRLWLEFPDAQVCPRCDNGTGCGAGLFTRLFLTRTPRVPLPAGSRDPGQCVRVGVNPRWVLVAAAVVYLLPVVLFVVGVAASASIFPASDVAALAGGAGAVLAGVLVLRRSVRTLVAPRLHLIDCRRPVESGRSRKYL